MANIVISNKKIKKTKTIKQKQQFNVSFDTDKRYSSIQEILPFRIKFTAIQIPGYGPNNIPAIPLQIIGFSNYIL